MDTRTTSIVAYLTWIGTVIAFIAGDREGAKFHLNQALVIIIAQIVCSIIMVIPVIGWVVGMLGYVFILVCWIMGLVAAIQQEEKEIPLLGKIKILQ